jgi:26S proteasome regulatory subunit N5
MKSTTKIATALPELCYEQRDYAALNSNISLLSKKHGQMKTVIQAMVEQAMGWLDEIKQRDGLERWLELVETLRTVTEGKVRSHRGRAARLLTLSPNRSSSKRLGPV